MLYRIFCFADSMLHYINKQKACMNSNRNVISNTASAAYYAKGRMISGRQAERSDTTLEQLCKSKEKGDNKSSKSRYRGIQS